MKAVAGDRLIVRSTRVQDPARGAEVLEVPLDDGSPPYIVRWSDDGREGLVFPGPGSYVEHFENPPGGT